MKNLDIKFSCTILLLIIFYIQVIQAITNLNGEIYSYKIIKDTNLSDIRHRWDEVQVIVHNEALHDQLIKEQIQYKYLAKSSYFVDQPVYISLTTISERITQVYKTIVGLVQAKVVPTHIYLCISEEPFLLDKGIKSLPNNLLSLVAAKYLSIIYTENIGPHRKLLPVLKHYWGQDVFIATVDDDSSSSKSYSILYQLLKQFSIRKKEHVIALRARRIGICYDTLKVKSYGFWTVKLSVNKWEMLLLPTGTGGILYKPKYFHEIVFDKGFWKVTTTADDIAFRLATMVNEIPIQLGCTTIEWGKRIIRRCKEDNIDNLFNQNCNSTLILNEQKKLNITLKNNIINYNNIYDKINNIANNINNYSNNNNDVDIDQNEEHSVPLKMIDELNADPRKLTTTTNVNNNNLDKLTLRLAKTSQDLFTINRRGGNDQCWKKAVNYLSKLNIMSFTKIIEKYINEREKTCFKQEKPNRQSRMCSTYQCNYVKESLNATNIVIESI